jgi:hypothetical protein
MPKTITTLKKAIAAFTRRSEASFVVDSNDNLLQAINNAKDFAQREVDFEFSLVTAYKDVPDVTLATSWTSMKLDPAGTDFTVKKIKKARIGIVNGTGTAPIRLMSRAAYLEEQQRLYGIVTSNDARYGGTDTSERLSQIPISCVQIGENFFIYPADVDALGALTNLRIYFDAIKWIPDFTTGSDTSFLLDYGFDFMLFRSIFELNFLLKEEQRFNVSMTILNSSWDNFRLWNSTFIQNQVDDVSLD